MTDTILQELGGIRFIRAMVPVMYNKVLKDDLLAPYFSNTDQLSMTHKMTRFLGIAFGDRHHRQSVNLRAVHHKLKPMGVDDQHFDAFTGHLRSTLEEQGVDQTAIQHAMSELETMRSQVLNR